MKRVVALILFLMGCGTGGADGGGDNALPNPGYAPYEWLESTDGLRSILTTESHLNSPHALVHQGRVHLYLAQCLPDTPCRIVEARSPDGIHFEALTPVADHPDGLRHPFVTHAPQGLVLYAVNEGTGALLRFAKTPNGFADPMVVLTPEANTRFVSPSVTYSDGKRIIFIGEESSEHTRFLMASDESNSTPEPIDFQWCVDPCWSAGIARGVDVRRVRTATGRIQYRAIATVQDNQGKPAIAYAVSDDKIRWSAFPFNPVLEANARLREPSQVRFQGQYFIYAVAGQTAKVVAAMNNTPAPSVSW